MLQQIKTKNLRIQLIVLFTRDVLLYIEIKRRARPKLILRD